jgi:hypothetical protein
MRLEAGCPRCPSPVSAEEDRWACPVHGRTVPLWRAVVPEYDAFAEYLVLSRGLPTWLPWPLPPGWQVIDFGCVGEEGGEPRAAFVSCSGPTELDGIVEVTVVTEEPGGGLGARIAGVAHTDPGREISSSAPGARVRLDAAAVPVWAVDTSDDPTRDDVLDRSVLAGESMGRWLWLVLRPASAALFLNDLGALHDVTDLGPELVTLPFGSVPRAW